MPEFEKPVTCKQIAAMTGNAVSAEYVRAACRRAAGYHPLPHMECGDKRPIIRIRPSVFAKWYAEEELLQVGT